MPKTSQAISIPGFFITFAAIAALSGILLLLRLVSNISFLEPLHLITSGSEEQSFLSLWKAVHGHTTYTDPHKIPFTSSYVNWLFYFSYGSLIKVILGALRLSDTWIPTLGRLITLFFSIAGFWITHRTFIAVCDTPLPIPSPPSGGEGNNLSKGVRGKYPWFLTCFVAFYLFFGPLPAFWPLTTRPDMAAAVFEILAFYVFIKHFQSRPGHAILTATFFSYAAWSFKQTNITIFSSLFTFCLIHNRRLAWQMMGMMAALCSLTLWLGGPEYRQSTLFSLPIPGYSAGLALKNFFYYLVENAFAIPGYFTMAAAIFSKTLRQQIREDKIIGLCFLTALVGTFYGLAASFKIGASENYFIPASIFVTLFLFKAWSQGFRTGRSIIYFSLALNASLILAILFGIKGEISKRYEHHQTQALLQCSQSLPRPIFSQTVYLNLPWMLGGPPDGQSFIPGYTYWLEKGRENIYESGGIEGLIKQGYFRSLLLEKARLNEIFRASGNAEEGLKQYVKQQTSCPETHLVFIVRR